MSNNFQDPEKLQDLIAILVLLAAGAYMFFYAPGMMPKMPPKQAQTLEPIKIDFVTLEKVNYSLFKEYDAVTITPEDSSQDRQRENPFMGGSRAVSAKTENVPTK